jgi:hypothetical protein
LAVGFFVTFGIDFAGVFLAVAAFALASDAFKVVTCLVKVSTRACNSVDFAWKSTIATGVEVSAAPFRIL